MLHPRGRFMKPTMTVVMPVTVIPANAERVRLRVKISNAKMTLAIEIIRLCNKPWMAASSVAILTKSGLLTFGGGAFQESIVDQLDKNTFHRKY
mmetsp:Transcript_4821/g.30624  ORF Transcript_4821/g.30624 Transcript_4821/m.30624 type:complete len:94 (+) Transcript_4821:1033-1314(+)